jgi:tryptophanyl-tRNA synthetase
VGLDQAPHIEFARETVRSFNFRFNTDVLVEPQMKVTEVPKVLGIDGQQKMGKSLNNHIELAATPEETTQRVMQMVTDPQRIKRSDPGNPDICNVFSMHKVFSSPDEVSSINVECRRAGIGCVQCKQIYARNLNANLEPFRTRRTELDRNPEMVFDVLHEGQKRAGEIAQETMRQVKDAMGLLTS